MSARPPALVGALAAVLCAAAIAAVGEGRVAYDRGRARRVAFHEALGGLGFGPAADLSRPGDFDPRVGETPPFVPVPSSEPRFPTPPTSLLAR